MSNRVRIFHFFCNRCSHRGEDDYLADLYALENPYETEGFYVGHEFIPDAGVYNPEIYVTRWDLRGDMPESVTDGYILVLEDNAFQISETPQANPTDFAAIENLNIYDWISIGGSLVTYYFLGRFVSLTDEGDTWRLELSDVLSTYEYRGDETAVPTLPIQIFSNVPKFIFNAVESVLQVRNIETHPQSQLIEAVEIGKIN